MGTMLAREGRERKTKAMKRVPNLYIFVWIVAAFVCTAVGQSGAALDNRARDPIVDKKVATDFEGRVRLYTTRREEIEDTLPKLSKQATAEQIQAHKAALLKAVLLERRGAKRGVIFSPDAEQMIRSIVVTHYSGRDRMELRKELAEAENKTVPVKVNAVYPEAAELVEMPPTLLLVLPQLPKQVRYRFVGNNLLIVDRENHLIVDYMTNALP